MKPCELCAEAGGELILDDGRCRVILVGGESGAVYPGFCRVIWNRHVAEMSDLPAPDQRHLMAVVCAVETALRQIVRPDKINLASLGNMVPHVHWHIIPRWRDDPCFPGAIWAEPVRPAPSRPMPAPETLRQAIRDALPEGEGGL